MSQRIPRPGRASALFDRLLPDGLGPIGGGVLLVAPLVISSLFYVSTHATTVRLGYSLAEARRHHERSLETNKAEKLGVAALRAPARLMAMAAPLGLGQPTSEQVVRLGAGDGEGVR
jgi:hypothetical protein